MACVGELPGTQTTCGDGVVELLVRLKNPVIVDESCGVPRVRLKTKKPKPKLVAKAAMHGETGALVAEEGHAT